MTESPHTQRSSYPAAVTTRGNPDGKARNSFMLDWQRSKPQGALAKPRQQLLVELFTSMLVLSATFKFRPVVGTHYYLYWLNNEWSLSLVAPQQWSPARRSVFAGTCVLQRDMTWTLDLSASMSEKNSVSDALRRFYEAFANSLDSDEVLENILPFYIDNMPYYQRLYASALSRSVRTSLNDGAQADSDCRSWQALLPGRSTDLLGYANQAAR